MENNEGLHAVDLSNNSITEKHAENVLQILSSSVSQLKYINLSDNYLTDESFEGVEITDHLRSIILRNNSLKNEGALILMSLLHSHPNLRRIDLSKNMVSIKYLDEISALIQGKPQL